jgi:hypothetical protein
VRAKPGFEGDVADDECTFCVALCLDLYSNKPYERHTAGAGFSENSIVEALCITLNVESLFV